MMEPYQLKAARTILDMSQEDLRQEAGFKSTAPIRDFESGKTKTLSQASHDAIQAAVGRLGVEFIEQPLPADDWEGQRRVFENSSLPLIADESCILEADVAACEQAFHGVNIKLVKCGGLTPARRMIRDAKSRGLKVMVGCMTESTVGISAIAQLLPELDYVDMDGAALLSKDIARGATVVQGRCQFPAGNGSGAELFEDNLIP